MTENFERFPNRSKSPAAETLDRDIKNCTYSKVKNFTSETNNNITREELKSVQKSIALFKQDIRKIFREVLFKFLNEGQQQQAVRTRYINNN
jgi:hypothetical protein